MQDEMFLQYLRFLNETESGEDRDEKAKKAVLDYMMQLRLAEKRT